MAMGLALQLLETTQEIATTLTRSSIRVLLRFAMGEITTAMVELIMTVFRLEWGVLAWRRLELRGSEVVLVHLFCSMYSFTKTNV